MRCSARSSLPTRHRRRCRPPGDWVVATTTGSGTNVDYTVTAADDRDPNPQVTCTPPSGSFFPLGLSQVTCTATDNAGNTAAPRYLMVLVLTLNTYRPHTGSRRSTCRQRAQRARGSSSTSSPPMTAATRPSRAQTVEPGAAIGWNEARDFPIGDTAVDCTATADAGNSTKGSLPVHVQGASEQL